MHDPREYIRGLRQILISDKKRIGFLFGAGASLATGVEDLSVPAIEKMTASVVASVGKLSKEYSQALQSLKDELLKSSQFNVETLLSLIEAKRAVVGSGQLNGLTKDGFSDIAKAVKKEIVELVSIHQRVTKETLPQLSHSKIAAWTQRARRRSPPEIFTTNYDYLMEIALEHRGIPYFDGFSGSYEPFFCAEAVEDLTAYRHLVKLWKIHGSLGWTYRKEDEAVIRKQAAQGDSDAVLIYPSHLKYRTSKKQPYIGLIDRLCAFLQQDDAVLITCGYSFSDEHVNERMITSLRRGTNSHVFAMYYDEYWEGDNAKLHLDNPGNNLRSLATTQASGNLSVYGLRGAVIAGKYGPWKLRDEPKPNEKESIAEYFSEDTPISTGPAAAAPIWTGLGRMFLSDFVRLSSFFDNITSPEPILTEARQ